MQIKFSIRALLLLLLLNTVASAQSTLAAHWTFDQKDGRETISGAQDQATGIFKYVPGVAGQALQLDGYTSSVLHKAAPQLGNQFSVEAWVALEAYPWTWCAVMDAQKEEQQGYYFGIDPEGRFGLHLAIDGQWQTATSEAKLPLYQWNHLVATFDSAIGVRLYLNGKPAGAFPFKGAFNSAADTDLLLGRNKAARLLSFEVREKSKVLCSLEGILDEVKIYRRALSEAEAKNEFSLRQISSIAPLRAPQLPSGAKGKGRFGAFYTKLQYNEFWDRLWRVGEHPDVVVRFDQADYRFVFWRGTSFIPCWVSENGIWYTNEFFETNSKGLRSGSEPMADKQTRFSHVRIIESSDARAVVHWRYAPVDVLYGIAHEDQSGWGDWVDEYYTIYPDGVAVRKIELHSTKPVLLAGNGPGSGGFREFHESIIINPPGTKPDDNLKAAGLTLANMKGESHTYNWAETSPGVVGKLDAERAKFVMTERGDSVARRKWLLEPAAANIHVVNLKAQFSPFVIVDPKLAAIDVYAGEIIRERSIFPWWNHWPVAQQLESTGRWAVAPDRVSHSSLTHIHWPAAEQTGNTTTKIMLNGMTEAAANALVPLASSWLQPAPLKLLAGAFKSEGYLMAERAYVLTATGANSSGLKFQLNGPLLNPAFVIKGWSRGWGEAEAQLTIDGKDIPRGAAFRYGFNRTLEGTDLVVWLQQSANKPVTIHLTPRR
jgi:hypothetical protein